MNQSLKDQFHQHLKNMVSESKKVKIGLEEFYQLHGTKKEVFKELELKQTDNDQERLNQLFPNEFILQYGYLTFNKEHANRQALENHILQQQAVVRQFYLDRKYPENRENLSSILKKFDGKKCPTCDVIMGRKKEGNSKLTREHIVPLSCGGDNSTGGPFPQCIGMCHLCNQTRNMVVVTRGKKSYGTQDRLTNKAVRFLITQVYGSKDDLDSELSAFFQERYNLAIRAAKAKTARYPMHSTYQQSTHSTPIDDSLLRIYDDDDLENQAKHSSGSVPQFDSSSSEFIEAQNQINLNLKFGQSMVEFEHQLRMGIQKKNADGSMFSFEDLQILISSLDKNNGFIEVTGIDEQDYDVFLYLHFEEQFIVQSVENSKFIHLVEEEDLDASTEERITQPLHEVSLDAFESPESEILDSDSQRKAKKNRTSLKVQLFRKTIENLIPSETQCAVEIEQIQTALAWICDQDGLEWDDYMMQHGISKNDDRNLEMIALLQKNGFSCTLQMKKNKLYAEFTLPHPFTES